MSLIALAQAACVAVETTCRVESPKEICNLSITDGKTQEKTSSKATPTTSTTDPSR